MWLILFVLRNYNIVIFLSFSCHMYFEYDVMSVCLIALMIVLLIYCILYIFGDIN